MADSRFLCLPLKAVLGAGQGRCGWKVLKVMGWSDTATLRTELATLDTASSASCGRSLAGNLPQYATESEMRLAVASELVTSLLPSSAAASLSGTVRAQGRASYSGLSTA